MNRVFLVCCLVVCLASLLSGCQTMQLTDTLSLPTPSVAATPTQARDVTSITSPTETQLPTYTPIPYQTPTAIELTPTAAPTKGKTIAVTSTEDSGPGTLRQALLDAGSGDTITFDPTVFPSQETSRIILASCLQEVMQNHLSINASGAGVILDGSQIEAEWCSGIRIISTSWNTIQGLRLEGFSPGAGVEVAGGAQHNLIKENIVGFGDVGFVLGGKETSFNTITGNLIGVDSQGNNLEQTSVGIWIEDDASHNTIANNAIAYNSHGIEVVDPDSVGNTITRNTIYDNLFGGISLEGVVQRKGGNLSLHAPTIIDFDLENGTVAGSTCPNCIVEIFSDERNQGRIFEALLTADGAGNFILKRTASFTGPHLTATATDPNGNTSAFSDPTIGLRSLVLFQEGNSLTRYPFQSKRSTELVDNRLGEMNPIYSQECELEHYDVAHLSNRADELGFKWMRVAFEWFDWAELEMAGQYSDFQLEDCQKQTVVRLQRSGIKVYYTLTFWDPIFFYYPGYSRFRDESEIERFLEYTRFITGNLKGNVTWYGILNEQNLFGEDQRYVEPNDYIELVRRVVPVIREQDPQAKIIIGEVTPLNEQDSFDYLMHIVRSDVMPLVDGIAWHGSSGLSLEYQPDFYNNYPLWVDQIVQAAREHGFKGEFFSNELHWRTPDTPQPIHGHPWFYSDIVAGKYYARGIVWHLAQGFFVGIGHEHYEQIFPIKRVVRNLATLLDVAEPTEMDVIVEGVETKVQVKSFTMPDGSHLIALWRDEIAVDNDPGLPVTLIFPGFADHKVTGIDVLHGFEQELITSIENGNLVIRDFLVKDYPLILRLSE